MTTFSPVPFALVGMGLLASCVHSQSIPAPRTVVLNDAAPQLQAELLATPVSASRAWSSALAPNARGGWNFITQLYEVKSDKPTEYVVVDLQTGKYTITEGTPGQYTNSNYQWTVQARAANGRIFFSELNNVITYYDPKDEKIHTLGQVIDPKDGDKFIFRLVFGSDGKLYGTTQANKLPTVVQIDPETLQHRVLGRVGKDRQSYSYGYYLAADPTPSAEAPQGWVYVAVGQTPWELAALNVATGESKVLAKRADSGWINFGLKPEGVVGSLTTRIGRPDAKNEQFWLVDGQMHPYVAPYTAADLPFKAREVTAKSGQLQGNPQLDTTQYNADAEGVGRVFHRPAESKDDKDWKEVRYKVNHISPIIIESLAALPDGTLLGNSRQYHGFFRYDPKTGKSTFFGAHGPSGGSRVVVKDQLYITGYPSSVLYVYDPAKPWTSNRRLEEAAAKDLLDEKTLAALNPRRLGYFRPITDTHFAYFLLPSKNGRLYFGGRIERTGTGGGVGWYDPATKTFGGHHDKLSFHKPRGMVVLDDLQRIVFSGLLQDDPAKPDEKPLESQLVVFDMELKEQERLTVKPGLQNTGLLFPGADKNHIIGVIPTENVVYRYDLAGRKLLDWIQLPAATDGATRRASDGNISLVVGSSLVLLDVKTMEVRTLGKLPFEPGITVWQGDDLYLTQGPQLHRIRLKQVAG